MSSSPNNQLNHNRPHEPTSFAVISPGPSAPMLFGSQTSTGTYVHKNDLLSFEMSMKTVEMCALINGTTPQEAYLQYIAEEDEGERNRRQFRAVSQDDDCMVDTASQLCLESNEELDGDNENGADETEDMFTIEL